MSQTTTIPCPHQIGADTLCGDEGGEITVTLYYEPADPSWGSDADGRRGIDLPGHFAVEKVADTCSEGCVWTEAERREVDRAADEAAEWYGSRDD